MQRPAGDPHRYQGEAFSVIRHQCFWAAFLLGLGTMAAIDEIVFHQILAWHHFYDRSTPAVGFFADGLLHAGELLAFVAGFFLTLDARRRGTFSRGIAVSGYLVGLGAFQLWDGLVHHKLLGLHQIRYGVDLLPYDLAWVFAGVVMLAAGVFTAIVTTRHVRRRGI